MRPAFQHVFSVYGSSQTKLPVAIGCVADVSTAEIEVGCFRNPCKHTTLEPCRIRLVNRPEADAIAVGWLSSISAVTSEPDCFSNAYSESLYA